MIKNKKNIMIYGAGEAGKQIFNNILQDKYSFKGFIDDDSSNKNFNFKNIDVFSRSEGYSKIEELKIHKIIIAIPSISDEKLNDILDYFSGLKVKIEIVPRIFSREVKIDYNNVLPINLESLIGRPPVHPDKKLLSKDIKNKKILITGAGGSIGSVISQITFDNSPKKITMIDNSELALHNISSEVDKLNLEKKVDVDFKICDISRPEDVNSLFSQNRFDTIYHAAAYKHVPILENNIIQAVRNNILGTYYLVENAKKYKSKKFVLISSDKAVRPTNIMGATKRFCELILQSSQNKNTIFTMVRFGNVFGSSGSVIPIFKKQIMSGGPVTVTSKKTTRYFMTINEASELVIQAAAMAKGGEVFLLDMGEPVNIYQLAKKMIKSYSEHSGSQIFNNIDIKLIGLRPGEKMIEELLIGNNPEKTKHVKILKSNEPHKTENVIQKGLEVIKKSVEQRDKKSIVKTLKNIVDGF
jgi:FlaA1/EpsC-like NDP-sugar epimerase